MDESPIPQTPQREPVGPLVATVIVVLVIAIGGCYFLANQLHLW